jgi:hypothetical protein
MLNIKMLFKEDSIKKHYCPMILINLGKKNRKEPAAIENKGSDSLASHET